MTVKFLLISFLTLWNCELFAATAKVIMVKGEATKLLPHKLNSESLKKGDILPADTSVVTNKGSFVKIEFSNTKTTMVIGPNSKVNIAVVDEKKGTVVSHLIGALRTKVNQKTEEEKVFIKTKSASMGVRGTEFLTVVNQENKATSVVTFEGKVAVVKVDKHEKPVTEPEKLVEKLKDKEKVTEVRKGRAVSAYDQVAEVTPPQKVQPQQLVALKNNETLSDDKKGVKAKEVELTADQEKELYAPDTEEEKKAPQKMGVVDLNSAIFVPTKENGEVVGEIDASGNYKPSEGLKLDPLVGFVPIDIKDAKTVAMAEDLNKAIVFKPEEKHVKAYEEKIKKEYGDNISRHDLYIGVGTSLNSFKSTTAGSESSSEYFSKPTLRLLFGWNWQFSESFKLLTYMEAEGIEYTKGENVVEEPDWGEDEDPEDKGKFKLEIGLAHQLSKRAWLNVKYALRDDIYLVATLDDSYNYIPIGRALESEGLTLELDYLISSGKEVDYYLLPRITFVDSAFDEYLEMDAYNEIGMKLKRKVFASSSYMQLDFVKSKSLSLSSSNNINKLQMAFDWIYVF